MPNKNGNIIIETALYGPVSLYQDIKHNEVMGYEKHSFKAQIGGLHGIYVTFSTFEEAVTRLMTPDLATHHRTLTTVHGSHPQFE
jgi:hypothetical protein